MPHLLEGSAVAGAVATGVRGVERINRFFAQHFGQVFQGSRLAAAEENLAVHVAYDGICVVLVDGFQLASDGTTARIEKIYEDILDGICDAVDQKVERLRNRYKYTDKATFRFFNDFAKGVKGILDMFPVIFCAGHGNSPFPPKRVVHD